MAKQLPTDETLHSGDNFGNLQMLHISTQQKRFFFLIEMKLNPFSSSKWGVYIYIYICILFVHMCMYIHTHAHTRTNEDKMN